MTDTEFITQLYDTDSESKQFNLSSYDDIDFEDFMKDTAPRAAVLKVKTFYLTRMKSL